MCQKKTCQKRSKVPKHLLHWQAPLVNVYARAWQTNLNCHDQNARKHPTVVRIAVLIFHPSMNQSIKAISHR